jgi:putative tryptophan/tyrosine transport system substrate-binding protein
MVTFAQAFVDQRGRDLLMIRRRDFIAGVSAVAWPALPRAQTVERVRRIGFLGASTPSASAWLCAFVQRLGELGWVEGRNLQIDVRWAEGRDDRAAEIAVQFASAKVDLIVTWTAEGVLAAKRATSTIPIVFAVARDPIGSGLVASLARPTGNATGLSAFNFDLVGKRVQLLREIIPDMGRVAILGNIGVADPAFELSEVVKAAEILGLDTTAVEVKLSADVAPALDAIKTQPQALFVVGDPLVFTHRVLINSWALRLRLLTMYTIREYVAAGGLMSYGTSFPSLFRRAAEFSDKILRGANPADIPVEQPTKFDLVINLKTAQSLGITVPDKLLAIADEVIE